jgi:hypothetical protein
MDWLALIEVIHKLNKQLTGYLTEISNYLGAQPSD